MTLTEADRAKLKALTELPELQQPDSEYRVALTREEALSLLRDVAVLKKLREWLVMYITCAQESRDVRWDTRYFHDGRVDAFMATMEELDRLTAEEEAAHD